MNLARSFFFLFLIAGLAISAGAADNKAQSQASADSSQNQSQNAAAFGAPSQDGLPSSGLLFLNGEKPRLNLTHPVEPKSATLDDELCYTMRTYKVKRTERLADDESGMRGYSTCELAKNYQVRSAVAHPQDAK
jgi:hypothetical protein